MAQSANSKRKAPMENFILTNAKGTAKINTAELPDASIVDMMKRGFNHYTGSVQNTKVTNKVKALLAEQSGRKASDIGESEVNAWRKAHESESERYLQEYINEALQALREGTTGMRATAAPKRDRVDIRLEARVLTYIENNLKSHNLVLPKDDSTTIDWGGEKRTRSSFIENVYRNFGAKWREEVIQELAEEDERARQKAEQLAQQAAASAEDQKALGM